MSQTHDEHENEYDLRAKFAAAKPTMTDKMEDLAPADEWVTICLRRRDDGGLQVCSHDLPGLILSGANASKVAGAIPAAIEALKAYPDHIVDATEMVASPAPPASIQAVEAEPNDLVERLRYIVGNPSAWDSYEEGKSELVREAATALQTAEAALASETKEVAHWHKLAQDNLTRAETAEAARDKLAKALEEIAESDDIDNALDPERNKRVARVALDRQP